MEGLIRQLLTMPQLRELTAGIDGREKQAVFSLFWKIDGAGCIRNGICRIFCIKPVAKRRKMWYDMKLLNSGAVS